MTTLRRTTIDVGQACRAGLAVGAARLVFPFAALWHAFTVWFAHQAVRALTEASGDWPPEDGLGHEKLTEEALSLEEWLGPYTPPHHRIVSTVSGFQDLAQCGDDLAAEDGQWRQKALELDQPACEAVAALTDRLANWVARCLREYGCAATVKRIQGLREDIIRRRDALPKPGRLDTDRLKVASERFRAAARPSGALVQWILTLWKKLPARWWLTESDRTILERSHLATLNRAAAVRHEAEMARRKAEIYRQLLGDERTDGVLTRLLATVNAKEQFYAGLVGNHHVAVPTPAFNVVLVADSLEAVIDPARRATLRQLYLYLAKQAGQTPAGLAQHFREEGIVLGGQKYLPGEWPALDRAAVRGAVRQAAASYLGSAHPDRPLNTQRPRTPVEYAAAVGLQHPALATLVAAAVDRWVGLSRPYAETRPPAGLEAKPHAYLFCYPSDRAGWERKLGGRVTLANPAKTPEEAARYAARHPFAAVLYQVDLGLPFGALADLPSWTRELNRQRLDCRLPVLVDHRSRRELRVLVERPVDYSDSERLVEAAVTAGFLLPHPTNADRFVLARPDARLDLLFAPPRLVPAWLSDTEVLVRLRDPRARHFLQTAFHALHSHDLDVEALAGSADPESACRELARVGVLEPGARRLYRLRSAPGCENRAPAGWFVHEPGPLVGLTKGEGAGRAYQDDLLYSVLFFGVIDALDERLVSPDDVPPFALRYWQGLER